MRTVIVDNLISNRPSFGNMVDVDDLKKDLDVMVGKIESDNVLSSMHRKPIEDNLVYGQFYHADTDEANDEAVLSHIRAVCSNRDMTPTEYCDHLKDISESEE